MTVRISTDCVLETEGHFIPWRVYTKLYAVQKGIALIIVHGLHELEPETKERQAQGVPLSSYRDAIKGVSFHISYVFFVFSNINSNENLDSG